MMKQYLGLRPNHASTPDDQKSLNRLEMVQAWGWRVQLTHDTIGAPYYEIDPDNRVIRIPIGDVDNGTGCRTWECS